MAGLDIIMGRPQTEPDVIFLTFDTEIIVRVKREERARIKALIEKIGEDRFEDTMPGDSDECRQMSLESFVRYLRNETDLLVEY